MSVHFGTFPPRITVRGGTCLFRPPGLPVRGHLPRKRGPFRTPTALYRNDQRIRLVSIRSRQSPQARRFACCRPHALNRTANVLSSLQMVMQPLTHQPTSRTPERLSHANKHSMDLRGYGNSEANLRGGKFGVHCTIVHQAAPTVIRARAKQLRPSGFAATLTNCQPAPCSTWSTTCADHLA